jgi:F-box and WD-40 domain protein CDC4
MTCLFLTPAQVLTFIDDPTSLARSLQVSKRWHALLSDDAAWKLLCESHRYKKPKESIEIKNRDTTPAVQTPVQMEASDNINPFRGHGGFNSSPDLRTQSVDRFRNARTRGNLRKYPRELSYRTHFKQRYMIDSAWRHGGKMEHRQITPDHGVVTSLHLTDKYIVVALDNAKIHVFDTEGCHQKTLIGHMQGVWAMVPWEDTLVSGGCDRDVRVWNMATGYAFFPSLDTND